MFFFFETDSGNDFVVAEVAGLPGDGRLADVAAVVAHTFKSTEDVYRYSDDLKAYITIYDGTNVNSTNYDGQKLRLFSFMVYDNNGTKEIVPSDGYAEVDRYQPQS